MSAYCPHCPHETTQRTRKHEHAHRIQLPHAAASWPLRRSSSRPPRTGRSRGERREPASGPPWAGRWREEGGAAAGRSSPSERPMIHEQRGRHGLLVIYRRESCLSSPVCPSVRFSSGRFRLQARLIHFCWLRGHVTSHEEIFRVP